MLKIVFCFNSGEHRQADSTDLHTDGPYRPLALVVSSGNSDHTSDEDAGYCKFVPTTAVDTASTLSSPTSSYGSSSGSSRDQEDDDPVYDYPRDWTLPEVLVTLPSGK